MSIHNFEDVHSHNNCLDENLNKSYIEDNKIEDLRRGMAGMTSKAFISDIDPLRKSYNCNMSPNSRMMQSFDRSDNMTKILEYSMNGGGRNITENNIEINTKIEEDPFPKPVLNYAEITQNTFKHFSFKEEVLHIIVIAD